MAVSKEDLAGPLPWYKTIPGTAGATEEAPGVVCLSGSGTEPFTLEMRGVMEFKTSVATGNTPSAVKLAAMRRQERQDLADRRERDKLVKVLSATVVAPVLGSTA